LESLKISCKFEVFKKSQILIFSDMKKLLSLFVFCAVFTLLTSTAFAQQYFVYDGESFNVMLTCNLDNSQVLKVSFTNADKTKWVPFEISDYKSLDGQDEEGGFVYTVVDGAGKTFTIDYRRTSDQIVVTNTSTGDTWSLKRRP